MVRKSEKSEGIVLRSLNYRDREQIVTILSEHSGLISMLIKGIVRPQKLAQCTLFTKGEYLYRKSRGDLYYYVDGTILEPHLFLRENLDLLEAAGGMAQAVLSSQMPEKPSPLLFSLLSAYLQQLRWTKDPKLLTLSFRLKVLKHEGIIGDLSTCTICGAPNPTKLRKGEPLCNEHALPATSFTGEEWKLLEHLLNLSRFSELTALPPVPLTTITNYLGEKCIG